MSMLGGYQASLGGAMGSQTLASQQVTPHTENQNVTAGGGASKSALHWSVGAVVVAAVLLLIGRGALRNARIG